MKRREGSGVPSWRAALAVQMFVIQVSWVGSRIMLGYRAVELDANAAFIALLASSFAAPALLASVVVGRLTDRYGGGVVSVIGSIFVAIGCLLPLLVSNLSVLLPAAAVIGLGSVGIFVGQQTFVAHRTLGRDSDGDFGNLATAASLGQLLAPPAVTWLAVLVATPSSPDTSLGLLVSAVAGAATLVPSLRLWQVDRALPVRAAQDGSTSSMISVMRTPALWRAIVVSGAILVTMDLLYTFIPLWAAERGISATVVGLLLAVRALVSVASRVGLARIVGKFGRKPPLVVAMGCGVIALVALPFSGTAAAFAAMVGLGISLGLPQPLTMAWIVEIVPIRDHGAALGLRMAGNRLAQTVIPIAMVAVAGPLGAAGVILANGVLLAIATVLAGVSDPGGPEGSVRRRRHG